MIAKLERTLHTLHNKTRAKHKPPAHTESNNKQYEEKREDVDMVYGYNPQIIFVPFLQVELIVRIMFTVVALGPVTS